MNQILRPILFFSLLVLANTSFAICERLEQITNPFCIERIEFDNESNARQDIKNLSKARDDIYYILSNDTTEVIGNVMNNDWACNVNPCDTAVSASTVGYAQLDSTSVGKYGSLTFDSSGNFSYVLNNNSAAVQGLRIGQVLRDSFVYTMVEPWYNFTYPASIQIYINGATEVDNVEIENNNRSSRATPLASAFTMKGNLNSGGDKDWYALEPSVEDKIIRVELCPQGSSCFGENAWVLYVFDGSKLTEEQELAVQELTLRRDDTQEIIARSFSNNMYLNYRSGVFSEPDSASLIGIIDPCFGDNPKLDIGVSSKLENYYIAVSSPLLGDGNTGNSSSEGCGAGNVVLTEPGPSFNETNAEGQVTEVTTTREFITIFPSNDDQYTFSLTVLDSSPAAPVDTATKTSRIANNFDLAKYDENNHIAKIPSVRIDDELFAVELRLKAESSANEPDSFSLSVLRLEYLNDELNGNPLQAIYDAETQRVHIPYLQELSTGDLFDVWLKLVNSGQDGNPIKLELLQVKPVDL